MRLLSFPSFSNKREPAKGKDWTQQEIADFYRAHRLLAENGAGIGIDRGLTDIGEPWLVFYDLATHDVFMHVARIGSACFLICDTLGIKLSAADISNLILEFEMAVREHLAVRAERNNNVVLHPAAKIIMSISAVFLLFKLDSGSTAHAKGMATSEHSTAADLSKKSDFAPLIRAQNALVRLFETVDSPRAVASLAGVILTGELLLSLQPMHQENAELAHLSVDDVIALPSAGVSAEKGEADDLSDIREVAHANPVMHETETHRAMVPVEVTPAVEGIPHKQVFEGSLIAQVAALEIAPTQLAQAIEARVTVATNSTNLVANIQADSSKTVTSIAETAGDAKPESVKALEALGINFQATLRENAVTVTLSDTMGHSGQGNESGRGTNTLLPVKESFDISLMSLDHLNSEVGFYVQTSLPQGAELTGILAHFLIAMNIYDVEHSGGKVFIEQDHIADLASADIGLWTNVMSDGSTISIVGQLDLIDDVKALVA